MFIFWLIDHILLCCPAKINHVLFHCSKSCFKHWSNIYFKYFLFFSPGLLVSCIHVMSPQRQQPPVLYWGDRQPCQLPPPTEGDRTKRDGEGKRGIKGRKMETLLTFLIRAWSKSCSPCRVSRSNLLTNENMSHVFFHPFSCWASGCASLPLCPLIGSLSLKMTCGWL